MLRHSSDSDPGITRKRIKSAWGYFDAEGKRITDRAEIDRLNAIALPPAYTDAWFCTDPDGHLQATGIDARGRKQYRYHLAFRERRDAEKYDGLLEFGKALPRLGRRVEQDVKRRKLGRETVLAAIVRLLDTEYIRIGNAQYAKDNKSFGATTLRTRHVRRKGIEADDALRRQARHRPRSEDQRQQFEADRQTLPGPARTDLFQYIGDDGDPRPITSGDVNDYIKEATGGEFTAKHFRTWGASVIAFEQVLQKAGRRADLGQDGGRTGRRSAWKHGGDEPQILRPPGAARSGQATPARPARRRRAAARRASGCRRPKLALLDFLAGRKAARRRKAAT